VIHDATIAEVGDRHPITIPSIAAHDAMPSQRLALEASRLKGFEMVWPETVEQLGGQIRRLSSCS
jgi:hypothetical protein